MKQLTSNQLEMRRYAANAMDKAIRAQLRLELAVLETPSDFDYVNARMARINKFVDILSVDVRECGYILDVFYS